MKNACYLQMLILKEQMVKYRHSLVLHISEKIKLIIIIKARDNDDNK